MKAIKKLVAWLNYVLNKPSPGDIEYPHHLPDNSFENRLLAEKKILELYRKLIISSDQIANHPRSKGRDAGWAVRGVFQAWVVDNHQLLQDVKIDISYYEWFPVIYTPQMGYKWVFPRQLKEFRP